MLSICNVVYAAACTTWLLETCRVKKVATFESAFQASLALKEKRAEEEREAAREAAAAAEAFAVHEKHLDSLKLATCRSQRLLHAWVLVKAGARGVNRDTFVETTSGRQYPATSCPYTGTATLVLTS
jgi:hypothetical protein